jgi:hypothetical protein
MLLVEYAKRNKKEFKESQNTLFEIYLFIYFIIFFLYQFWVLQFNHQLNPSIIV